MYHEITHNINKTLPRPNDNPRRRHLEKPLLPV